MKVYSLSKNIKSFRYTNGCSNGGFENDLTDWSSASGGAGYSNVASTEQTLSGSKSAKLTYSSETGFLIQDITFPVNHVIYIISWCFIAGYTAGTTYMYINGYGQAGATTTKTFNSSTLNAWQKQDLLFTSIVGTGGDGIRIRIGTGASATLTSYFDDVMAIDLTSLFGAGNEPSLTDCANIFKFVDGTKQPNFSKMLSI